MLTDDERRGLLRLARETLRQHLGHGPAPAPARLGDASRHSGAFVTLHVDGDLRGCIGYPGSRDPLDEVVARCAIAAATDDPRFSPLEAEELPRTSIEISVLTPIVPVETIEEIEVGRDGLVMEQGFRRGLLLPQVPTEYGWDRETFLSHTCLKAGLPSTAWKTGARMFRFQAEVFSEEH